jgi:cell division protease FtsH
MLIFKKLSTGASDDLMKATNIAREMVMRYGMTNELGFVSYEEAPSPFLDIKESFGRPSFADDTAKEIDECVKTIVMKAYNRALQFLTTQKDILDHAAHTLMDRETLNEEDLRHIFERMIVPPMESFETSLHH